MPDHLHAVVGIVMSGPDRASQRSNLVHVIGKWKSESARHINNIRNTRGLPVWQRSFYDHIIRDEEDLWRVRQHIADNPSEWRDDVPEIGQSSIEVHATTRVPVE